MTDSKKKILQFMSDWMSITNHWEIEECLNIPLSLVDYVLDKLEEEKIISFSPNREWVSLNQ